MASSAYHLNGEIQRSAETLAVRGQQPNTQLFGLHEQSHFIRACHTTEHANVTSSAEAEAEAESEAESEAEAESESESESESEAESESESENNAEQPPAMLLGDGRIRLQANVWKHFILLRQQMPVKPPDLPIDSQPNFVWFGPVPDPAVWQSHVKIWRKSCTFTGKIRAQKQTHRIFDTSVNSQQSMEAAQLSVVPPDMGLSVSNLLLNMGCANTLQGGRSELN